MIEKRICQYCGEEFIPQSNNQIYCKRPHYMTCPACGKQYLVANNEKLKKPPTACSYPCRVIMTRRTSLEKYGTKAPGNNPEARKKARLTMMEHLGVPYALQSQEVREKSKETCLKKYGVENAASARPVIEKRLETSRKKYGKVMPFNRKECYDKQHDTIMKRYGVRCATLIPHVLEQTERVRISRFNLEFEKKLNDLGYETELEKPIIQKIFDIHIPSIHTLVEIDPTYTHNFVGNHWDPNGLPRYYHIDKTRLAEENGFKCIHVWDWDDTAKITEYIAPRIHLDSDDFEIYRLNKEPTDDFLKDNSIYGTCKGQILNLGLVKDQDIYQVISLGKAIHSKDHNVEILRMCTKLGYSFNDGYKKLFSYITSEYGLYNLIAYCDHAKSDGSEYEDMGMKLIRQTEPRMIWSKNKDKISESTRYQKKISREQLLKDGWLPVYDCGQLVFEY